MPNTRVNRAYLMLLAGGNKKYPYLNDEEKQHVKAMVERLNEMFDLVLDRIESKQRGIDGGQD